MVICGLLMVGACSDESGADIENAPAKVDAESPASSFPKPDESQDESTVSVALRIVTTLYPLEYFAGRIAGDDAEVTNLIAGSVDAHDFEPSPRDIQKLAAADIIIYNGAGFEHWLDRALGSVVTEATVVETAEGIAEPYGERAKDNDYALDPHVWLDPIKAMAQVTSVKDAMMARNPTAAGKYDDNTEALLRELEDLHQRYESGLAACRYKHIVTSHDAFGYLAERYGLEPVPLAGLTPEAEPTPRRLALLSDRLRELNISYVMTELGVSGRLAATVAKEIGATILELHPLASLTPAELARGETYFTIMDANLRNLKIALECAE